MIDTEYCSFKDFYRRNSKRAIHAEKQGKVTILTATEYDRRYMRRAERYFIREMDPKNLPPRTPWSVSGSKENPWEFLAASGCSPHMLILEMFYERNPNKMSGTNNKHFQINDWVFRLEPDGVVANDGVKTLFV